MATARWVLCIGLLLLAPPLVGQDLNGDMGGPAGGNNNNAGGNNSSGGNNNNSAGNNNNSGGNNNNAASGNNNNAAGGNNNAAGGGNNAAGGNSAKAANNNFGGNFGGNSAAGGNAAGGNAAGGNAAGAAGGNAAPANGTGNTPPNDISSNVAPLNPSATNAPANAAGTNIAPTPAASAPTNSAPPGAPANGGNNAKNSNTANNGMAPANANANPPPPAKQPKYAPANGKYEMRFQFDQSGQPSLHSFVLKWPGPTANLASIDVMVADTNEVIQTIQIPQDLVHLVWMDVTEKPGEVLEKFIDVVDYNFDKHSDLRILRSYPYKVGQKYYLVWLFDDQKNQYVLNEEISKLQAPQADQKRRRIWAIDLGGFGGGEYVQRAYSINAKGKLKVQTKITQTVLNKGQRLTFLREVRVRKNGELQRVCKFVVPAEGVMERTWGNKTACAEFTVKGPPANVPPLGPVKGKPHDKKLRQPVAKLEPIAH